jgi:hypothetical protein
MNERAVYQTQMVTVVHAPCLLPSETSGNKRGSLRRRLPQISCAPSFHNFTVN